MTRRVPAPLAGLGALLALYLAAPLVAGLARGGWADWHDIDGRALLDACAVSVSSASVATLIIAVGGVPLGYLLARAPGRLSAAIGFLVQLPLALPPLASGILLLFLVGYSSPLGRATAGALTDSFAGIVLAEVFVAAPFLVIAARSAFAAIDPVLEGVGATLGRRPLEVFFRIALPMAWPSVLSGMLLAWLRAFGEFGATVMVAYHPYSLPVYTYVAFGAQGLPAMLPVLVPTLVLALLVLTLSAVTTRSLNVVPTAPSFGSASLGFTSRARPAVKRQARAENRQSPHVTFEAAKRLGTFQLQAAWSTRAHRVAILGPSGSGKSLTLKLIAGLEHCDDGSIRLDERELADLAPAARGVAYVPQNYGLFPHLTVIEHLHFPRGADPHAARDWIGRLGLEGLEDRRPAALSLGQQQRVALARALVRPARLLLLDEPLSALDAPRRSRVRSELRALQQELSAATILVTHDPMEAALLADEIVVLEQGRVLQSGSTQALFRRPANETVARLLGADYIAYGTSRSGDQIAIDGGGHVYVAEPELTPGQRVGWTISAGGARLAAAGAYSGTVESTVTLGIDQRVIVRIGDARIAVIGVPGAPDPGSQCRIDIDARSVQVWPVSF
ncbi:MAG TPA: ATP-binding cassette domain-containing protein [Steroidobacteraceae bacterium]|nr:ATP-binding cassette domain-containing protein [Steroidobacteraceae bacterium]